MFLYVTVGDNIVSARNDPATACGSIRYHAEREPPKAVSRRRYALICGCLRNVRGSLWHLRCIVCWLLWIYYCAEDDDVFDTCTDAITIEKELLSILKQQYSQPVAVFDGSTETFVGASPTDIENLVIKILVEKNVALI